MKIKIKSNKTRKREEEIVFECLMQYWCSSQRGISLFVGFECSPDWNLFLKGLDDCVLKPGNKENF